MAADRRSGDPSDPADRVELIDPLADGDGQTQVDRVSGRAAQGSRATMATLIGGVLVVALLLFALGRADTGAPDEADAAPATTPDQTLVGADADEAGLTTTAPPGSTTTTEAIQVPAPVLGQPSGLSLLYGGDGPLQSLDLDTGSLTTYGLDAHPVLVTGGELVLYQEDAGIVGWVPLDDPGQQALTWKRGQVAPGSGPGLLWVLDPEADEPHPEGIEVGSGRWELFDVARNRITVRLPADLHPEIEGLLDGEPLGGSADVLRPGPFVSSRPDGVYLAIEDGFERVADGRLLTHDRETALVGRCGADEACELGWIDVGSGERIDRPVPNVRPRVANLVAGGAWVHSIDFDGTSELLELDSGRRIVHHWPTDRPTISPDGRWLAEWFGTTVVISDLGGGVPRTVNFVDVFEREGPGSLLLVATG